MSGAAARGGKAVELRLEHGVLVGATILAALGQLLFKMGATDRSTWRELVNIQLLSGFFCYALGTLAWIFALSKLPLRVVYPYTALTFVLVYLGAVGWLGEKVAARGVLGIACVLLGLFLLTTEAAP